MRGKFRILKGKSVEEQLLHAEKALEQLSKRSGTKVIGAIPPAICSNFTSIPDESGDLLRWIFPFGCKIMKGVLYVEEFVDKEPVRFVASVDNEFNSSSQVFDTRRNLNLFDINVDIQVGSRLRFYTLSPERVKNVWVAFSYECPYRDLRKDEYAIEEFERLIDAGSIGEGAEEAGEETSQAGEAPQEEGTES